MGKKKKKVKNVDMSETTTANFEDWNAFQLGRYMKREGLDDYSETFQKHKVNGALAPLLQDDDLKDIGVELVGDRLRFRSIVRNLNTQARFNARTRSIWKGQEQLYYNSCHQCISTCGLFPQDPSSYNITFSHIRIKQVDPARCGRMRLCCCYSYSINNVDMSKINDVNVNGRSAPFIYQVCCCARGLDEVEILSDAERVYMTVSEGQGTKLSQLILHQVEECQNMQRE